MALQTDRPPSAEIQFFAGFFVPRTRFATPLSIRNPLPHLAFVLFRLATSTRPVAEVERAGGKLLRRGEFSAAYPYAYVHDPDGYEVEIWYE